jgi:hypothetical protein
MGTPIRGMGVWPWWPYGVLYGVSGIPLYPSVEGYVGRAHISGVQGSGDGTIWGWDEVVMGTGQPPKGCSGATPAPGSRSLNPFNTI